MSKRVLVFVYIGVVCYEGTVRSSFLSANTFFYILAQLLSFLFDMGLWQTDGLSNISIDKARNSKHKKNKTLLRYRSQKKDDMFRPFLL